MVRKEEIIEGRYLAETLAKVAVLVPHGKASSPSRFVAECKHRNSGGEHSILDVMY